MACRLHSEGLAYELSIAFLQYLSHMLTCYVLPLRCHGAVLRCRFHLARMETSLRCHSGKQSTPAWPTKWGTCSTGEELTSCDMHWWHRVSRTVLGCGLMDV
jgi:hypothetical protein